jgi:hypothetical protein
MFLPMLDIGRFESEKFWLKNQPKDVGKMR